MFEHLRMINSDFSMSTFQSLSKITLSLVYVDISWDFTFHRNNYRSLTIYCPKTKYLCEYIIKVK